MNERDANLPKILEDFEVPVKEPELQSGCGVLVLNRSSRRSSSDETHVEVLELHEFGLGWDHERVHHRAHARVCLERLAIPDTGECRVIERDRIELANRDEQGDIHDTACVRRDIPEVPGGNSQGGSGAPWTDCWPEGPDHRL